MSMHKIPLTELERAGLEAHHLAIGTPSQLSDCFRQGVAWALKSMNQEVKPYTLQHIHCDVSLFNGVLWFLLNGSLLRLCISMPAFNDFQEYRISKIIYTPDAKYNPQGNSVKLNPAKIRDIHLTHDDLRAITAIANGKIDTFTQYGNNLLTSTLTDGILEHSIFKTVFGSPVLDSFVKAEDYVPKQGVWSPQGLYNILIPIVEDLNKYGVPLKS